MSNQKDKSIPRLVSTIIGLSLASLVALLCIIFLSIAITNSNIIVANYYDSGYGTSVIDYFTQVPVYNLVFVIMSIAGVIVLSIGRLLKVTPVTKGLQLVGLIVVLASFTTHIFTIATSSYLVILLLIGLIVSFIFAIFIIFEKELRFAKLGFAISMSITLVIAFIAFITGFSTTIATISFLFTDVAITDLIQDPEEAYAYFYVIATGLLSLYMFTLCFTIFAPYFSLSTFEEKTVEPLALGDDITQPKPVIEIMIDDESKRKLDELKHLYDSNVIDAVTFNKTKDSILLALRDAQLK
jgi:hypothetical protein